ncbi:beta-ketoacyl-ACP synthase 3 [Streptomyces millisiae]|uniref:Beta-ketoacyl-ACP synthase 3 n=1 Tax=Streptomyces millisiae TaxID=3075542 RepID=A0ABU2LRF9_9ACTN|nr:beta-ketoacyl-ACP synthase 3 [Streptomyces sp. DSM 44918]MDT0319848.1 beta-ketoacyl-ACP synthase 3 [Streptomyces sp. DSM 44918]
MATIALSPAAPGARIVSLGHFLPATVLTSEEVASRLTVDAEWIVSRTGIRERRIADKGETVADLATAAARRALEKVPDGTVDTVLVATSTPESTMPSVATRVAGRLGLPEPSAFDVNAACAGFCYALATADSLIRTGASRGVLLVGADKASAFLDWADRDTAVLFADGAGAAVVQPAEQPGVGPVLWGSAGERGELITIDATDGVLRQNGPAVYRWASGLGPMARRICDRAGIAPDQLAAFIPHQANLRIVNALATHLKLREENYVATDVVDTGNTMAATIPLALSRMSEKRSVADDEGVLLFGFGAGLSYAGQIITLNGLARA